MRRPRNMDGFVPRQEAADWLRDIADRIEKNSAELVRFSFNVRFWDESWADLPKRKSRTP